MTKRGRRRAAEPGDIVRAGASVSWSHYDTLGTPDDGPYAAWISPWRVSAPGDVDVPLATEVEFSRYVTDVRIELGSHAVNGVFYGPNVARVEFRLANVVPGMYQLLHCNYPCTTRLGDITWGSFWVGPPEPGAPSTSGQAPPPTVTNLPTPTVLPAATTTLPRTTATATRTAAAVAGAGAGAVRRLVHGTIRVQ